MTRRREKKILSRAINAINLEKFNENLSNTNWSLIIKDDDPNEAYNDFIGEFSRIYEVCFPLKVFKGKQMNKLYSSWLSRGLSLKSINKKNRLYKKLVRLPTTYCELKYKAYKNKLNHLICIAKRTYYDSKLEDAKNDLRTTWKLVNEVINKRKNNPSPPSSFKSDDKTITDPMDIADRFCKYFTNIGPNLASAIPTVNSATIRSFLGSRDYPPFILKPTDTRELENICSLFLPRKHSNYHS